MDTEQSQKRDETYDIVIRGIQALQETCRAPTSSENDNSLFRGIIGKLRSGMFIRLCNVVEDTASGDNSDKSNTAESL